MKLSYNSEVVITLILEILEVLHKVQYCGHTFVNDTLHLQLPTMFHKTLPKSYASINVIVLKDSSEAFKESINENKAIEILLNVLEAARCKFCGLVIAHTVALCKIGHAICRSCKEKATVCPTCTKLFTTKESPILSSVLSFLPRECRNKGCQAIVTRGDDHDKKCAYEEIPCKLCSCAVAGRNIMSHMKNTHPEIALSGKVIEAEWRKFHPDEDRCDITPILIADQFMWGTTRNDVKQMEFVKNYIFVPNGKTNTKIRVTVMFGDRESDNFNVSEKELSLNPYSSVTRNTIVIPTAILHKFTDSNNILRWREEFFLDSTTEEIDLPNKINLQLPPKKKVQLGEHLALIKRTSSLPDVVVHAETPPITFSEIPRPLTPPTSPHTPKLFRKKPIPTKLSPPPFPLGLSDYDPLQSPTASTPPTSPIPLLPPTSQIPPPTSSVPAPAPPPLPLTRDPRSPPKNAKLKPRVKKVVAGIRLSIFEPYF